MLLPRLDSNDYDNAHLHDLLRRIDPDDGKVFVKKFTRTRSQRTRVHLYRELLIGAHLRDRGFTVRYESDLDGLTPDWTLFEGQRPLEIIDVLTLHQRRDKEIELAQSAQTVGEIRSVAAWLTVPPDHIYRKLSDKAGQYSHLTHKLQTPYVIAVYGEWIASIDPDEMHHVLFNQHEGWFKSTPEVSGIIYCRERDFTYDYTYFSNPHPSYKTSLLRADQR